MGEKSDASEALLGGSHCEGAPIAAAGLGVTSTPSALITGAIGSVGMTSSFLFLFLSSVEE
jgi:hypothetical protein